MNLLLFFVSIFACKSELYMINFYFAIYVDSLTLFDDHRFYFVKRLISCFGEKNQAAMKIAPAKDITPAMNSGTGQKTQILKDLLKL